MTRALGKDCPAVTERPTMPGLEYQHIGHDPCLGEIALWSVDDRGNLHEQRRDKKEADLEWLDWSHERAFPEVKMHALGRVELVRCAGSIHISDPVMAISTRRLARLLDTLEDRFPSIRWYLFGSGFHGESLLATLAGCALG